MTTVITALPSGRIIARTPYGQALLNEYTLPEAQTDAQANSQADYHNIIEDLPSREDSRALSLLEKYT